MTFGSRMIKMYIYMNIEYHFCVKLYRRWRSKFCEFISIFLTIKYMFKSEKLLQWKQERKKTAPLQINQLSYWSIINQWLAWVLLDHGCRHLTMLNARTSVLPTSWLINYLIIDMFNCELIIRFFFYRDQFMFWQPRLWNLIFKNKDKHRI